MLSPSLRVGSRFRYGWARNDPSRCDYLVEVVIEDHMRGYTMISADLSVRD